MPNIHAKELRGRHSDHRKRPPVELYIPAEHIRVAAQLSLPEFFADHHSRRRTPRCVVVRSVTQRDVELGFDLVICLELDNGLVKAVDPAAVITDIRVEEKAGGRTGSWRRS